jgi:hypothetical protein
METIELRFDGNGIKPSKVSASEIAGLLISYERAITSVIKANHPEVTNEYVFLSLDEVKEGSLSLKFSAHLAVKYVLPAYALITTSFETQDFNQLPNSSIEDLRVITGFAKRYKCDGHFIKNGQSQANFDQYTEIAYNDSEIIRGETTIYGEVLVAGGRNNPRATLKINSEYTISIAVKKYIAKQLATQLYNEVGLKGIAKWDKRTYRVLDFSVDSVVILEEKTLTGTFKDLSALFGEHINRQGDYNTYLS